MGSWKFILALLIFITLLNPISAELVQHYTFSTEDNSQIDLKSYWFVCKNEGCTEIVDAPTSTLFSPNPIQFSIDEELNVIYPDCMETDFGYIVRIFPSGFPSYRGSTTPVTYECYYHTYDNWGNRDVLLEKKDNCKAEFTPTIQSCAEAGLPHSILTDTQLDATTSSAFDFSGYYYPSTYYDPDYSGENFDEWIGVDTKMRVDVTPQGSSSSVSGFPSTDQAFILSIPPHDTHNFEFLWQTSKDTDPGTYTVTMESSVPDAKCDQSNDVPVTKSFDVYIAPTLDGCVAEFNSFEVNPPNPDINQEITFTGTHLNTFQNWSYTSPTVINCPAL